MSTPAPQTNPKSSATPVSGQGFGAHLPSPVPDPAPVESGPKPGESEIVLPVTGRVVYVRRPTMADLRRASIKARISTRSKEPPELEVSQQVVLICARFSDRAITDDDYTNMDWSDGNALSDGLELNSPGEPEIIPGEPTVVVLTDGRRVSVRRPRMQTTKDAHRIASAGLKKGQSPLPATVVAHVVCLSSVVDGAPLDSLDYWKLDQVDGSALVTAVTSSPDGAQVDDDEVDLDFLAGLLDG